MRTTWSVGSLLLILAMGMGHAALAEEGAKDAGQVADWEGIQYRLAFWPPGGPPPGPHHPPSYHPPAHWPSPPHHVPPRPGGVPLPFWPQVIVTPSYAPPPPGVVYAPPTPASIRIVNPATNTAILSYTLNGHPYTMAPGQEQVLAQTYVIEFNRGGTAGLARYSLTDGVYAFTPTADGNWDLFRSAP